MPRKSDTGATRKSDVSVARFVLADSKDESAAAPRTPAPADTTTAPDSSAAAETLMTTSSPREKGVPARKRSSSSPGRRDSPVSPKAERKESKEKEKEREKEKEKEKEKEGSHASQPSKDAVAIEDLNLPKSIITRLAKGVLPSNTQIQANAILAMTKSATVFINYLANAANEVTVSQNKKTIMPQDVLAALDEIEFGFMREQLEAEFEKFNQMQTSKRSSYRKKAAAAKKASISGGADSSLVSRADDPDAGDGDTTRLSQPGDGRAPDTASLPRSKKQKVAGSAAAVGAAAGAAAAASSSKMDVDGDAEEDEDDEQSDPEEEDEGDEDDAEDEEEEEDEHENDEEDREDEDEEDEDGEDGDPDSAAREDDDEALDDGNDSE